MVVKQNEQKMEGYLTEYLQETWLHRSSYYMSMNVDEIIEALEENSGEIREICETASKYAPDYDTDKICKELLQEQ